MERYRIIRAGGHDADLVAIMVSELVKEVHGSDDRPVDHDILLSAHELMNDHSGFYAFLAFDSVHHPVGILSAIEGVSLRVSGKFGIITDFYVAPSERSKGLGEQMLYRVAEMGRELQWSRLELVFPKGGRQSVGKVFFARNGFKDGGKNFYLDL